MPDGPVFVVNGREQAQAAVGAAAAAGAPVILLSLPAAAASAGVGWFHALVEQAHTAAPDTPVAAVLDCGDMAGYAMSGLRRGFRWICLHGAGRDAVAAVAADCGASVLACRPVGCDLTAVARAGGDVVIASADAAAAWMARAGTPD